MLPGSLAIVGASQRMTRATRVLRNLLQFGYRGRIFPTNPYAALDLLDEVPVQCEAILSAGIISLPWWYDLPSDHALAAVIDAVPCANFVRLASGCPFSLGRDSSTIAVTAN
jgi:hypothetical protein